MLNRNLVLSGDINELTVRDLIKSIWDINAEDDELEEMLVGHMRRPIQLVINSRGGYVDDGLALMGTIQLSKTPVYTIGLGMAASMALFVLISGHKRFMHGMATTMYHDISTGYYATLEQHRRHQQESERQAMMLDRYLVSRTKIRQAQLNKVRSEVRNWYIDAPEALRLGVVDEILSTVTP